MGEQEGNRKSIVWDWVGVYPAGARWEQKPPEPAYHGRPVEDVATSFEEALQKTL